MPKANTVNICCDGFAHNCQFVMPFNACITVVMNKLTHVVLHKVGLRPLAIGRANWGESLGYAPGQAPLFGGEVGEGHFRAGRPVTFGPATSKPTKAAAFGSTGPDVAHS